MSDPRDAQVLGHELLLRMLVSEAKLGDARLQKRAMQFLDRFLGSIAAGERGVETDELLIGARAKVVELLNTRDDIFVDNDVPPPQPLSWKRRLFLWLAGG